MYKDQLVQGCYHVMRMCSPGPEELQDREHVLKELRRAVTKFNPMAQLTVFGSSSNGFAFARSVSQSFSLLASRAKNVLKCRSLSAGFFEHLGPS